MSAVSTQTILVPPAWFAVTVVVVTGITIGADVGLGVHSDGTSVAVTVKFCALFTTTHTSIDEPGSSISCAECCGSLTGTPAILALVAALDSEITAVVRAVPAQESTNAVYPNVGAPAVCRLMELLDPGLTLKAIIRVSG
jgi:hypothetical protein